MKYFNVCSQLVYKDGEGKERKQYYQAGVIKLTPNGMMYLRLFTQPAVEFFIFPQEKTNAESLTMADIQEE